MPEYLSPGRNYWSRATIAEFERHCIALLRDNALRRRIAASAGMKARQRLSQPALQEILRGALAESEGGRASATIS